MRKVSIFIAGFLLFLGIFASASRSVIASEGQVELRSTLGDDSRCFAASVLMQDLNYNILMSCRDLIYPAQPEILSYAIWATGKDDGKVFKLGALNFGKVTFRTPKAFVNIFITQERNVNEHQPKGIVVMKGDLMPITFLETRPHITPTITPNPKNFGEIIGTVSVTPTPISTQSKASRFVAAGGLLALGGIFVLIMIIVFVTRPRK